MSYGPNTFNSVDGLYRKVQSCLAVIVLGVYVWAPRKQITQSDLALAVACPVQRRGSSFILRLDIDTELPKQIQS